MREGRVQPVKFAAFNAGWLQQREPFDTVARTAAGARLDVSARLAALRPAAVPWRIIDLACGTGANLRWLAPRLDGPQQWLVVDQDEALLQCWPASLAAAKGRLADDGAAHGRGDRPRHETLHFGGPGFDATIVRRRLDLAQRLEALPWPAAHLVTASALLDLVSLDWLQRLVAASAASRTAVLFALSMDGRHCWTPRDPQDNAVAALFGAHQQRDKGFGPALGARAVPALRRLLRHAGYRVRCERSDWQLDGRRDLRALALQRALIDDMAEAACEQDPAAAASVCNWQRRRHALAARGSLSVGHLDLLALPPG
jgi:hypothetical protein